MNQKVLEQIAGKLKLDAEKLAQSLSSDKEDETLELPNYFTESEVNGIKDNIGKEKYDAGATASREMTLKELSDLVGLKERAKDKESFIKRFEEKVKADASIEPNQMLEELKNAKQALQDKLIQKENEFKDLESNYKKKEEKSNVRSLIPELPASFGITKDEAVSLFFLSHEKKEDGIYKNGEKLKDNLENPLDINKAVSMFISEKGWDKDIVPPGRADGVQRSSQNGKPKSLKEYEEYISEQGINIGSQQANALLKEMAKENPEILKN